MSLITLVRKWFILGEDNTRYRAMLYYLRSVNIIDIHFVIIKDLEADVTVC